MGTTDLRTTWDGLVEYRRWPGARASPSHSDLFPEAPAMRSLGRMPCSRTRALCPHDAPNGQYSSRKAKRALQRLVYPTNAEKPRRRSRTEKGTPMENGGNGIATEAAGTAGTVNQRGYRSMESRPRRGKRCNRASLAALPAASKHWPELPSRRGTAARGDRGPSWTEADPRPPICKRGAPWNIPCTPSR
jgi:hypothetical protein